MGVVAARLDESLRELSVAVIAVCISMAYGDVSGSDISSFLADTELRHPRR